MSSIRNVRLHCEIHQCLMALVGELQAERGNRVTANDAVAMLLSDYLAKEIEVKESEFKK